jgi:hypothetical protein
VSCRDEGFDVEAWGFVQTCVFRGENEFHVLIGTSSFLKIR